MGGSQSSRKLTLANDDPSSVIRVSDAVVQRFRGSEPTEAVSRGGVEEAVPAGYPPAASYLPPANPTSLPRVSSYPAVTSLQIRQEKEAELRANDQHWQNRISQLEETHHKINELMEREYNSAMTEMRNTLMDGGGTGGGIGKGAAPCGEGRRAVLRCYKEHSSEPMLCARQVQAFADCVDKHRSAAVR